VRRMIHTPCSKCNTTRSKRQTAVSCFMRSAGQAA
jgi:hypothetical protein